MNIFLRDICLKLYTFCAYLLTVWALKSGHNSRLGALNIFFNTSDSYYGRSGSHYFNKNIFCIPLVMLLHPRLDYCMPNALNTSSGYWVTQKLPEIYTANHATFPIWIRNITVQICGNFWVTQYVSASITHQVLLVPWRECGGHIPCPVK